MGTTTRKHEALVKLLEDMSPKYLTTPSAITNILNLNDSQATALQNLLTAEASGRPSFHLRDKNYADLYQFDWDLNYIVSAVLASSLNCQDLPRTSGIGSIQRDVELELAEISELKQNGYTISHQKLNSIGVKKCKDALAEFDFVGKGTGAVKLNDRELSEVARAYDEHKGMLKDADTFWIDDINVGCRNPVLRKLAFDPYILAVVAGYLGCCPIHVQTNLWFSFPSDVSEINLSRNAQMFHQDKEFENSSKSLSILPMFVRTTVRIVISKEAIAKNCINSAYRFLGGFQIVVSATITARSE
jgi:hypothetical protein